MTWFARRGPGVAFLAHILVAWEIASLSSGIKAVLFPPPSVIFATLISMAGNGQILVPLSETMYRLAFGYGVALCLGVGVGVVMGYSTRVYNLLEPLIELIRPIPKAALVAPLIFFLGFGDPMKISVIALGVFFPILINTIQGVRAIEPEFIQTARTFGCGTFAILRKVVLPATLPQIFAGMHVSLGIAFILVIIAEMISADGGLGYAIALAQRSFRVKEMYAWIFVLAITGYSLNAAFLWLRSAALHWTRDFEALERAAAEAG